MISDPAEVRALREQSNDELSDRDSLVAELKAIAERARKHAGWGPGSEAYKDLANMLDDVASDFSGNSFFKRIEQEIEDEAEEDSPAQMSRWHHSRVL